jgi:hypothetical protein
VTRTTRTRIVHAVTAALLLLGSMHCGSVIGIEDAKCDPDVPECNPANSDVPSALCREYCSKVMANCKGENSVYEGSATCLAVCKVLPEGKAGNDNGNTVRCRLHQAEVLCSDNCDGYCSIMQSVSDDYGSLEACKTACNAVPDLGGYNTSHSAGDSVQCRLWHVSAAADEPNPHCLHAAGKSYCVP